MFRNYFKLALRHVVKHKAYVFINISGLSIGLACSIIIALFVVHEISYDKFNLKKDRIYRLYLDGKMGETELKGAWTCSPAAAAFVDDFPEVINAVRLDKWGQTIVKYNDKSFIEDGFMLADSTFFDIFSIPLIQGNPKTVLARRHTLVLTKTTAGKIFGNTDPMGKMIKIGTDSIYYTVSGIMEDVPDKAHFTFNMLGSFITDSRANSNQWLSNNLNTYLLLEKGASIEELQKKTPEFIERHIGPEVEKFLGASLEEFLNAGNRYGFFFQGLEDIHLDTDISHDLKPSNDKRYLYTFAMVAILILIIAAINYMNLATAQSAGRAKEVGIRKVMGSNRKNLIWQFLLESLILTIISITIALVLVELLLPFFNKLIQVQLELDYLGNWFVIPGLLLLSVFISLMAGAYPAFFLSSFEPLRIMGNRDSGGRKKSSFRSILVIIQLTVSISLILGSFIVYRQINYMLNKNLGFEKEQLLVIRRTSALGNKQDVFLREVEKLPAVLKATHSTAVPGRPNNNNGYWIEGQGSKKTYLMNTNWIDTNYPDVYKLKIANGRFFSDKFTSDSMACVINESAVKQFGLENPMEVRFMRPLGTEEKWEYLKVVGVVKDFHYESLHDRIYPHIFIFKPEETKWGSITLKLNTSDIENTIDRVDKLWRSLTKNDPLIYFFLDQDFERLYKEDRRTSILIAIFSFLAIIIASLGLFGLTSFTVEQRTKEIGIRKVNGAKISHIIWLLSKEIVILVGISVLIAWPITFYIMKGWLQDFYFRINLSPIEFLLSLLVGLGITWLTIIYKAVKAATANPTDSLRYE